MREEVKTMQININLEKMRNEQRSDNQTGMSMQAVVNRALSQKLPNGQPTERPRPMTNTNGWGGTNA